MIDITNPASPGIVGSVDTPGQAWGVAVLGNYAYVADASRGLQVIDITNPASPGIVGSVDTPDKAWDVAVVGSYAYVADWFSGLQVVPVPMQGSGFIPATPPVLRSASLQVNGFSKHCTADKNPAIWYNKLYFTA